MAIDFNELLKKPVEEAKRPPALPAGTYYGVITGHKFQQSRWENRDTGEPDAQVRFAIGSVTPGEDIPSELLTDAAGKPIDLARRQLGAELPLSGGNEWVTRLFLEGCGINVAGGRGWGETIPEAMGKPVMFDLKHRPNPEDTSNPFVDIRNLRARPA